MNRQGFLEKEMESVVQSLLELPNVRIEGMFTHFAMAKNPAFPEFVKKQLSVFEKWIKFMAEKGQKPIVHAAATAGALLYPESHFDMVRIGIGLYGMWPSKETEAAMSGKIKLQPALTWKTIIGEVKSAQKGGRVGYDCTERLERDSKIGICPIGYWHGYSRSFSSIGPVLVNGEKTRVLGRISMDMIAIDLTDIKGKIGPTDEVVLAGKQGKAEISWENLASIVDMSHYELITRLNPLIRRIYL
jgi:alanine racemase